MSIPLSTGVGVTTANVNSDLSRTQYIYQFGKWGLQKYNTAKAAEETPGSSRDVPGHLSTSPQDNRVAVSDHGAKRPRSIQTIDSSDGSLLSSVPSSSKKSRLDGEYTVSTSPSSTVPSISSSLPGSVACADVTNHYGIDGKHGPSPLREAGSIYPMLQDEDAKLEREPEDGGDHSVSLSQSAGTDWPLPNSPAFQVLTPTESKASLDTSWLKFMLKTFGINGDAPSSLDADITHSAPTSEESYQACLDKATGLTTYDGGNVRLETDLDPLLQAADYLYAVLNKQRSFRLYDKLLRLNDSSDKVLTEMSLAYARAAGTQSQRDEVKKFLTANLRSESRTASSSEKSLANMLLAQMFSLDGMPDLYESHLASAAAVRSTYIDTSFDVLAYLYRMHPQEDEPRPKVRGQSIQSITTHLASVGYEGFVQFALGLRYSYLSENSTEYHEYPGTVLCDCVRSCVDWCAISIDVTLLGQPFNTKWLARGSSYLDICRWPEVMALYNYLYRKWRSDESDRETTLSHWGWRSNTRKKLGISAAELLIVCCDMITQVCEEPAPGPGGNKVDKFDRPYAYLRKNIRVTQGLTDEELVTKFLQRLYLRTTNPARVNKSTADSRQQSQSLKLGMGKGIAPPFADQIIRPPVPAVDRFAYASSTSNSILGRRYDPTIASSISSSNTSYRRMRDAASLIRGRFTSIGSKESLASRDSMASLARSIDNMSDIMRDSLSISEPPVQEDLAQWNS